MGNTALVKLDSLPNEPLARIDDLRATLAGLSGKVNIVSPVASVDSILPMHKISLRAVVIDYSVDSQWGNGPECYKGKFCSANERALGKVALEKIQAAAGVQTIDRLRLDDRSDPHFCEIQVTLGIRDFDGTWRIATRSRAIDFRDGSPDAVKLSQSKSPDALPSARSHIQQLAETKAALRALRTLLTLKQKYTVEELAKPFVVPKLVPALDPADPDQKAALIQMAVGGERALFGLPAAGESRQLREAPPPLPAAPPQPPASATPKPPPPVGTATASADADEDDFNLLDFSEAKVELAVCTCPCGCQVELTPEVAAATTEQVGAPRCQACYPGKSFDVPKHRDVRGTLNLPKRPTLTTAEVAKALEKQAAGTAKR